MSSNPIIERWQELKVLIESIDLDVHKNANGNSSAGVRARKGLRLLKTQAGDLVKLTVELGKVAKAEKA